MALTGHLATGSTEPIASKRRDFLGVTREQNIGVMRTKYKFEIQVKLCQQQQAKERKH